MKNKILAFLIFSSINLTFGNYTIVVPLEKISGGSLPNNSIIIAPFNAVEEWLPSDPEYTPWINDGLMYDCVNWLPETSSYDIGVQFTQTANDCKQNQIRNRQEREQESTTLNYRNVGSPIVENQTLINNINTRLTTGTRGPEQCYFELVHSSWIIDNGRSTAFFNGNLMVQNMTASSFNSGGYNYYAGAFVIGSILGQTATSNNYYICRRQL